MDFGSPEFVLAIIGMAMLAGVMKTAIRAKNGLPDGAGCGSRRAARPAAAGLRDQSSAQVEGLRGENRRLANRVETMEDRLIVLEKIVTDRGYGLASEIEALRDRNVALDARGEG